MVFSEVLIILVILPCVMFGVFFIAKLPFFIVFIVFLTNHVVFSVTFVIFLSILFFVVKIIVELMVSRVKPISIPFLVIIFLFTQLNHLPTLD